MTHKEIHKRIKYNDVIELYMLNKLSPDERRAFQEHFFECDECFEQAQMEARFIAGVREASRSSVLAASQTESPHLPNRLMPAVVKRGWFGAWVMPALAASLLAAVTVTGLWTLSVRRQNKLLSAQMAEQRRESERLQILEEKIRELEATGSALQEQRESLREEISRLKEQLTTTERQHEAELAQLRQPDINVPVRNVYPVGDSQRSGRPGEVNRIRVPRGTRTFVLILGDYKPGYSDYRIEIWDSTGRVVARREGLKPDQSGELSVMLNRSLLSQSKYRLKLYAEQHLLAEYAVLVE